MEALDEITAVRMKGRYLEYINDEMILFRQMNWNYQTMERDMRHQLNQKLAAKYREHDQLEIPTTISKYQTIK